MFTMMVIFAGLFILSCILLSLVHDHDEARAILVGAVMAFFLATMMLVSATAVERRMERYNEAIHITTDEE